MSKKRGGKMKWLKQRYQYFISILPILIVITLILVYGNSLWNNLILSIKSFYENIKYYICFIFDKEMSKPIQPYDRIEIGNNIGTLLPFNILVFWNEIKAFFVSIFNKETWLLYFNSLNARLNGFAIFISSLVPILIIGFLIWKNIYFSENEKDENEISLFLKVVFKINKPLRKVRKWIIENVAFFWNHKVYRYIFLLLLFTLFNGFSILLDCIGIYFYFFSSFEFVSLYKVFVMVLFYLHPILTKIPLIFYLVMAYFIFDTIRKKFALSRLANYENRNKGFVNSLGVLTFLEGPPKSGKTLMMSSLSLSGEELLRYEAYEIIKEIWLLFPHFPFIKLESKIYELVEKGKLKNQMQIEYYIERLKKLFERRKDKQFLFDYDYELYGLKVYNGLYEEYIFNALSDYARAYYLYSISCALLTSNYSVRTDGLLLTKGNFPKLDYDYFSRDGRKLEEESTYAKILDFDSLRLGKLVVKNNKFKEVIDGCIISIDEIGKERLNSLTSKGLKSTDKNANQLNDKFNDKMKMIRHNCTLRNRCLVKVFSTDQREGSVNSDYLDLNEYKLKLNTMDNVWKSSLTLWFVEPIICEWILDKVLKFIEKFRYYRRDNTLLFYLISSFGCYVKLYLSRRKNTFDYMKRRIKKVSGNETIGIEIEEDNYYLMKKKDFALRYSTDSYKLAKKEAFLKSIKGFRDLPEYKSELASEEDLALLHSYFIEMLFRDEDEDEEFMEVIK